MEKKENIKANFNKLGAKHHWVKGLQVCTNEGAHPLKWKDNFELLKI